MFIWYAAGLFVSIAVAWVSAVLHASVRLPVGVISIGVGLELAVALSTLSMLMKACLDRRLIIGTLALAAITALAQHAWLYIDFQTQWLTALADSPKFSTFEDEIPTPYEYFAHELTPARAALWCLDAVLIISSAVGGVLFLERRRREFGLAADANPQPPAPSP
jgi:hypothetical protein